MKFANLGMEEDIKMLRVKIEKIIQLGRVVAEVNGCFVCHGIDGRKGVQNPGSKTGYVPAWNTEKFARNMNSKAILKQTILSKSAEKSLRGNARLKMVVWEDIIKGKELHGLVNYIWSFR